MINSSKASAQSKLVNENSVQELNNKTTSSDKKSDEISDKSDKGVHGFANQPESQSHTFIQEMNMTPNPNFFQNKQVLIVSTANPQPGSKSKDRGDLRADKLQSFTFSIGSRNQKEDGEYKSSTHQIEIPQQRIVPTALPITHDGAQSYRKYKKALQQENEKRYVRVPGQPQKEKLEFEEQQKIIASAIAKQMTEQQQMGILTQPPNKVSQACIIMNSAGGSMNVDLNESSTGLFDFNNSSIAFGNKIKTPDEISKLSLNQQEIQCSVVTLLPQVTEGTSQKAQRKRKETDEEGKNDKLPDNEHGSLNSTCLSAGKGEILSVQKQSSKKHEIHMDLKKKKMTMEQADDEILQDTGFGYPEPLRQSSERASDRSNRKSNLDSIERGQTNLSRSPRNDVTAQKRKKKAKEVYQSIINMNLLSDLDKVSNLQVNRNYPFLIHGNSRVGEQVPQKHSLNQTTFLLLEPSRDQEEQIKQKQQSTEGEQIEIGNIDLTQSIENNETEMNNVTTPKSALMSSNQGNLTQRTNESFNQKKKLDYINKLRKDTGQILIIGNQVGSAVTNSLDRGAGHRWIDLPTQKVQFQAKQSRPQRMKKIFKDKKKFVDCGTSPKGQKYFEQKSESTSRGGYGLSSRENPTSFGPSKKIGSDQMSKSFYQEESSKKNFKHLSNSTLLDDLKKQGTESFGPDSRAIRHQSTHKDSIQKKSPFNIVKSQQSELKASKGTVQLEERAESPNPQAQDSIRFSRIIANEKAVVDVNITGTQIQGANEVSRQNLQNGVQTTTMYKQSEIDIINREKYLNSPFFNSEKPENSFVEELSQSVNQQVNSSKQLKPNQHKQVYAQEKTESQVNVHNPSVIESNVSSGIQDKQPRYHQQQEQTPAENEEKESEPLSSVQPLSPVQKPVNFPELNKPVPQLRNPQKHTIAIQTSKINSQIKSSRQISQLNKSGDLKDLSVQATLAAAYAFQQNETESLILPVHKRQRKKEESKSFFINEFSQLPLFKNRLSSSNTFNLLKFNDQQKVSYDRFKLYQTKDKLPKQLSRRFHSQVRRRNYNSQMNHLSPVDNRLGQLLKDLEASRTSVNNSQEGLPNPFPNSQERVESKLAEKKYFSKLQRLEKERIKLLQARNIKQKARVPNLAKGMAEDNLIKDSLIATARSKFGSTTSDFMADQGPDSRRSPPGQSPRQITGQMYNTSHEFNTSRLKAGMDLTNNQVSTRMDHESQESIERSKIFSRNKRQMNIVANIGVTKRRGSIIDNNQRLQSSQQSEMDQVDEENLGPQLIKIQNVNPIVSHNGDIMQKYLSTEGDRSSLHAASLHQGGKTSDQNVGTDLGEPLNYYIKGAGQTLRNALLSENQTGQQSASSNFPQRDNGQSASVLGPLNALPFSFTDNQVQLMVSKRVKKMQHGQVKLSTSQTFRTRSDKLKILKMFGDIQGLKEPRQIVQSILSKSYQLEKIEPESSKKVVQASMPIPNYTKKQVTQETQINASYPESSPNTTEKQLTTFKQLSQASPKSNKGSKPSQRGLKLKPMGLAVMENPQYSSIKSPLFKKDKSTNEDIKFHLIEEAFPENVNLRITHDARQTMGQMSDEKDFVKENISLAFERKKTEKYFKKLEDSSMQIDIGEIMKEKCPPLDQLLENISEKST